MTSFNNKYFIYNFFQNLYNDISLEGFCGIKGSFVIGDNNNFFFNRLIELNTVNKFPLLRSNTESISRISNSSDSIKEKSVRKSLKSNFGKLTEIPYGLRSHLKFFNFTSSGSNTLYEINLLDKPFVFSCESLDGKFCYKMISKNIKFYKFTKDFNQYLYLKFETAPTISMEHVEKAYHTYIRPKPRSSELEDCLGENKSDSKYLFYHAENRDININQQKMAADIVGLSFKKYLEEKEKYSGCLTNKKCELGNEIYIPESYVNNYYMENFQITYPKKQKSKSKTKTKTKTKTKSKGISKTRKEKTALESQIDWLKSELAKSDSIKKSPTISSEDLIAGKRKRKVTRKRKY